LCPKIRRGFLVGQDGPFSLKLRLEGLKLKFCQKLKQCLSLISELGLCIEKLKEGFTLESLWQILPPDSSKRNLLD
jgi:hypothetical protein